jgi:transcriptional regulator with PAS, ATPase and Fis domain
MVDTLNTLLEVKGFGRIAFNQSLEVTQANSAAQKLLSNKIEKTQTILVTDIFPELIGVECQLSQIVAKKISHYQLDLLNRTDENENTLYLNLLVIACSEEDSAIVVIEDATLYAIALQKANQQRYDTYLYRCSIEHRRNQVGRTFLGQSQAIKNIVDTIQQLGHVPTVKVLLTGETGTGKTITARMIHESAMADDAPFVEINCAALPEQLLEAELFGYEKGAFTGAISAKPGLLEEADGGTLFLDEIGELPLSIQAKLLSAIESKTFPTPGQYTLAQSRCQNRRRNQS